MRRTWLPSVPVLAAWTWAALAACTAEGSGAVLEGQDASVAEASITPEAAGTAGDAQPEASTECPSLSNDTPRALACTGLYTNLEAKQIADDLREFTPAAPLWSDGADKLRWIYLPPGATIDATNTLEWKFPVGTKLWKEFRVGGRRIETRFFHKLGDDFWVHASYQWANDELSATRVDGADLTVNDTLYHIPTPSECDKCHNGRRDRVLGFDAVSLGLGNAAGITLERLVKDGRLSPTPSTTTYQIDDGTGKAARALAWLNINCGVSCHNDNTTALGYPTGMRLRLEPTLLDGGAPNDAWAVLQTTLNVGAVTPRWVDSKRIVPGRPDSSLIVRLISHRGTDQMPPIASLVVDEEGVQLVRDWIASMPLADGGASEDAGSSDGGSRDSGSPP
jgi:hypothetical protein